MRPADLVREWIVDGRLDDLTGLDRFVLLDIAERAGSTGMAWPSAERMAADYGYHYRTIRRAFARIEASGIAVREPVPGRPARWSFRHHPAIHNPAPLGAGSEPSTIDRPRADEREPRADERATPRRSARGTYEPLEPPAAHHSGGDDAVPIDVRQRIIDDAIAAGRAERRAAAGGEP